MHLISVSLLRLCLVPVFVFVGCLDTFSLMSPGSMLLHDERLCCIVGQVLALVRVLSPEQPIFQKDM
jgi:hypothetical protein